MILATFSPRLFHKVCNLILSHTVMMFAVVGNWSSRLVKPPLTGAFCGCALIFEKKEKYIDLI